MIERILSMCEALSSISTNKQTRNHYLRHKEKEKKKYCQYLQTGVKISLKGNISAPAEDWMVQTRMFFSSPIYDHRVRVS